MRNDRPSNAMGDSGCGRTNDTGFKGNNGTNPTNASNNVNRGGKFDRPVNNNNGSFAHNGNNGPNSTNGGPARTMRNDRPSNAMGNSGSGRTNNAASRGNNPYSGGGGYGNPTNSHERNVYANDSRPRVQEHQNAPHPDKNQDRGGREQKERERH